jgi:uncharacterized protein (TIGR03435 family)
MRFRLFVPAAVLVLMLGRLCLRAEPFQAAPAGPAFEAASLKVDNGPLVPGSVGMRGGPGTEDPGRITWRGLPLSALIIQAYDVDGDRLFGRTQNIDRDRFILTATFPPNTTKQQFCAMLQNLLAERFHLVLHRESKEVPGYDVTLAAGGRKFGEWHSDPDVPARISGQRLQAGQGGFGYTVTRTPPMIHVTSRESMAEFCEDLPGLWFLAENTRGDADRDDRVMAALRNQGPVEPKPRFVDKTGLTGEYELRFDYEGGLIPGRPSAGGPTLFEALEKQLGLKLVKVKRVPVDVLVIDRVDPGPTGN